MQLHPSSSHLTNTFHNRSLFLWEAESRTFPCIQKLVKIIYESCWDTQYVISNSYFPSKHRLSISLLLSITGTLLIVTSAVWGYLPIQLPSVARRSLHQHQEKLLRWTPGIVPKAFVTQSGNICLKNCSWLWLKQNKNNRYFIFHFAHKVLLKCNKTNTWK